MSSLKDIAPVYYSFGNYEYVYIEAGHDDLQEDQEAVGAVVLNYQSFDIEIKGNPLRLGGQVIIPGLGELYNFLDGFFAEYDYGQYKLGDSGMIITRGPGSNPKLLPRFNNPPEIAVVDVEPE